MIHVLIGEGASGKSTIEKLLKEKGVENIISYTTRPKRNDERDGVDYHFISTLDFVRKIGKDELVEYAIFNNWFYGVSLTGIDYENKDYILVVTPKGFRTLQEVLGNGNLTSYYIKVSEHERLIRMEKRGDSMNEIFRRIEADREDFQSVEEEVDVVFDDAEVGDIVEIILDRMNRSLLKEEESCHDM